MFLTYSDTKTVENFSLVRLLIFLVFIPVFIRYFINIFISPWYAVISRIDRLKYKRLSYSPRVSVIIPAWNEEVGIINTIKSIVNNTYKNIEVIVINDGSTDNTDQLVRNFIRLYGQRKNPAPIAFRYLYKANGGKSSALNAGVKLARSEIIVTSDADSFMDKYAIENLVNYFKNPKVMSVAGNVKIGNHHQSLGLVQMLEYLYGFYFKKADSVAGSVYIVGGAAAAYRRGVFEQLGYFDESTLTEDIEISTRMQKSGMKILYAADVLVYTEAPSDLQGLIRQRLRWKRGRFETFYKHRDLFFSLKSGHNKYLSLFVLPLAFLSEILLFAEIFLLPYLIFFFIFHHEFALLISSILILDIVIAVVLSNEVSNIKKIYLFLWIPVGWLLFYFVDFVEYNALIRSLWSFYTGKQVKWQSWRRVGVFRDRA